MTTKTEIDARKERYGAEDAVALLQGMSRMIVAKGKKVTEVDLRKDRPDDAALAKMMLGPTGNLRAPAMKVGRTVLIGFHADTYDQIFS